MTDVGRPMTTQLGWQVTQIISPRHTVRAIPREASGVLAQRYSETHGLDDGVPDVPWAVNLADDQGRFHLLAFDLDAHQLESAAAAHRDAETLEKLLADLRIRAVTTASSGRRDGGRHLWIALTEPVSAGVANALAQRLGALLPSLDKAPLCNPVAGCVRPPGAPHRDGGSSTLLRGRIEWLTQPRNTPEHIAALMDALDARIEELPAVLASENAILERLPKDDKGNPHLAGERRNLSQATRSTMETPLTASSDASAVLWRVMLGCAAARWRFAEVVAHADAPGFEHARTQRAPHGRARTRRPRSGPDSFLAVMRRQWRRACAHVASNPRRADHSDNWEQLSATIAHAVATIQGAADASPGRWTSGRGPAARRALDALCVWSLEGLTLTVDAAVRLLGETATLSHEGARTALKTLQEWGLITFTTESIGTRAASWTLVIPSSSISALPHAVPRGGHTPPPAHSPWAALRATLRTRLAQLSHDVWTGRGVGIEAGNQLANPRLSSDQAGRRLRRYGISLTTTARELDQIADELRVSGTVAKRKSTHAVERLQYQWWLDEVQRVRDKHRPGTKSPTTLKPLGQYPRRGAAWLPNHREAARACAKFHESRTAA